jgi:hypothetical protein
VLRDNFEVLKMKRPEQAFNIAKTLIKHHRLIYTVGPDEKLSSMGSGVLLRTENHFFLITAAHVLDENQASGQTFQDLVTYGSNKLLILKGDSFRSTVPPGKTRDDDKIDIGFIKLEQHMVDQIGTDRFWPSSDVDLDDVGQPGFLYGALGYPAEMNRLTEVDSIKPINPTPFNYTTEFRPPNVYKKFKASTDTHVLLTASNKKSRLPGGRKGKIPDLRGMSGGGIWRLLGRHNLPIERPKLLAIIIESHANKPYGGILGTRMSFIFSAMRRVYPELEKELPTSSRFYIDTTVV